MAQGFNGTRHIVDVAGNAGLTAILATGPVRYVEIVESTLTSAGAANVPQGLEYQLPNDQFTQWLPVLAPTAADGGAMPTSLELGDTQARHGRFGVPLGSGPQDMPGAGNSPTPATTLANLRSQSAMGTSVVVTQHF